MDGVRQSLRPPLTLTTATPEAWGYMYVSLSFLEYQTSKVRYNYLSQRLIYYFSFFSFSETAPRHSVFELLRHNVLAQLPQTFCFKRVPGPRVDLFGVHHLVVSKV